MRNSNTPERITIKNIGENLLEILNFERGIFYTIRGLALTPRETIRHYLYEDRMKMVQPLKFLVITGIVSSVMSFIIGNSLPDMSQNMIDIFEKYSLPLYCEAELAAQKFQNFAGNYQGFLIAFSIPLIAAVSYFVFKKSNYNYAEHIVIAAYLFGFNNLLTSLNLMFIKIGIQYLTFASILLILFYFFFFLIQTFQEGFWRGILLSLVFLIFMQIISTFFNIMLFIAVSLY